MGVNLQVLQQKAPAAVLQQPFYFLSLLPNGQTINSATVTCTVWAGTDTNPGAIPGTPSISGQTVTIPLSGGVAGNIYKLQVNAACSDGSTQVLFGYLAVVEDPL
jgi:hypothetical protein